jgi:hypothetical protein
MGISLENTVRNVLDSQKKQLNPQDICIIMPLLKKTEEKSVNFLAKIEALLEKY